MKTSSLSPDSNNEHEDLKYSKNLKGLFLTGNILALFVILALIGFSSCEENMWLRSEKKVRNKLEGTWNRLFVTSVISKNETWNFANGVVVIVETEKIDNHTDDGFIDLNKTDNVDTITVDYGNYSVDAKIDNVYLKLSNLEENVVESAKQGLSAKWTFVDIDNHIMYIAADNGAAIVQREFEKK